jgi:hypothetical protein
MPDPTAECPKREEWTAAEREASKAWSAEHMERLRVVMLNIPEGFGPATMPCPGCGVGTVHWGRARSNKHLHAHCTTPNCFGVIQ